MKRPSHRQDYLLKHLIRDIEDGKYANQPFPYIREIAREKGFSLNVTRLVVKKLIDEGYLKNIPGSYKLEAVQKFQKPCGVLSEVICLSGAWYDPSRDLWANEIRQACVRHNIPFMNVQYDDEHDHRLLSSLRKGSSLIFMIPPSEPSPELLSKMRSCRRNLVTLWHDFTEHGISMVENTPFMGMELLLEHLREKGNRVIHCVSALPHSRAVNPRIKIWEDFLGRHGLAGQLWDFGKTGVVSAAKMARSMIHQYITSDRANLPDAFICTSSSCGIGVARGLADLGMRPGQDVALCAFAPSYDNLDFYSPTITSIKSPSPASIVEHVIEKFIGGKFNPGEMIQPESLELFVGESTGVFKK